MVGSRGLGAAGLDIVGRVRFRVSFIQSVVELELSKVRNTEVWHGQLFVISKDWDVKGLVVKVCRVSIGNMERERE